MRDRLEELIAIRGDDDYIDDIPISYEEPLEEFFTQVATIQTMIDEIRKNVDQVKELHRDILTQPHTDEKTKQNLENLIQEIKNGSNQVRRKLKTIEGTYPQSIYLRIQMIQHLRLSRAFVDVMNDYNNTQVDYRERCKCRIQRHLEITGKETTDQELEVMLEEGTFAVFTQDIMMERQERQRVADIEARHGDIVKLEKSIQELHDMFLDMAMLVENQGELIDRVEYQVELAKKYVETGTADFVAARKALRSYRKKRLAALVCLIVLVIIAISVVAGVLS